MATTRRLAQAATVCIFALAGSIAGNVGAAGDTQQPPPSPLSTASPSDEVPSEWQEVVDLMLEDVPGLTPQQALDRVQAQTDRITILEALASDYATNFGGGWYDPVANVQHVVSRSDEAAEAAMALGVEHEMQIEVHYGERSYYQLLLIAKGLNAGDTVGIPAIDDQLGAVTIEVATNQVNLTLYEESLVGQIEDIVEEAFGDAVLVRFDPTPPLPSVDEACYTRYSCGAPIRSGTVIGPSDCSLGYVFAGQTAKWVVTAGHCEPVVDQIISVGEQYVGPVRQTANINSMDITRARLDNPYWANNNPGGWQYNAWEPEAPKTIDYAIRSASTIQDNDYVCLDARYSEIHLSCGQITEPYLNYRVAGRLRCMPRR